MEPESTSTQKEKTNSSYKAKKNSEFSVKDGPKKTAMKESTRKNLIRFGICFGILALLLKP